MMKRFSSLLFYFSLGLPAFSWSQISPSKISLSGYVESYYCYDLNDPVDHNRPSFFYAYHRHNEVNINLGYLKLSVSDSNYRGNFALMAGTYANANLAAEPGVLKNIFEANAGIKISKKHDLWIDAGVFPSHIGFESAIGKDCWNLTRSILADNSPYFESGAKISYTSKSGKWFLSGLILNGWQRITRTPGNSLPSAGTQLTFKPGSKITFNWSSFAGSDSPDSTRRMRYFNNFYAVLQPTEKLGFIFGFDYGMQQSYFSPSTYYHWYSPVLICRFKPGPRTTFAGRIEYYNDPLSVIIYSPNGAGFQTLGYSLNFDLSFSAHALFRLEARGLNSSKPVFTRKGSPVNDNYFFTAALIVSI
jgi:hypothetical protein